MHDRLRSHERRGSASMFANLLASSVDELTDGLTPLVAEWWGSAVWATFRGVQLPGRDAEEVFASGLIEHTLTAGTPQALRVLRAVGSVAPARFQARAVAAAERLAEAGVADPPWAARVGRAIPTEAWVSSEPWHDDGASVMVGFDGPAGRHTLALYVDHNLGGIAKDGFAAPVSIGDVIGSLAASTTDPDVQYRSVPLEEAADEWLTALAASDATLDPPVTEDLRRLRALVVARSQLLPAPRLRSVPGRMSERLRKQIVDQFVGAEGLVGGDETAMLADQILAFSLDHVGGAPLRFSPVMAELFCLDWAPSRLAISPAVLPALPRVLEAWVRFAAERRGAPGYVADETAVAVRDYAAEMLELTADRANWSAGKHRQQALLDEGIDLRAAEQAESWA